MKSWIHLVALLALTVPLTAGKKKKDKAVEPPATEQPLSLIHI